MRVMGITSQEWRLGFQTGGLSLVATPRRQAQESANPEYLRTAQSCIEDGEYGLVRDYFIDTGLVKVDDLGVDEPTRALLEPDRYGE